MGLYTTLGIIGAYLLLSLLLLPMQYRYIKQLKEDEKERKVLGLTADAYYERMGFETQQLHFNAQGNLLFLGANLLATLVYNWKHKRS
ncbi:DUF3949 domain-containing protein [uncultured Metabacillus sp.]|uniref:DUF3949 domain-containing protein n=1 Tax=uncultured Metabacillus sp. TaxID=2860135 RepID=UPI00262CB4E8|nr:DUF3949 domain-containing protein [uncultured Metabacillus sp.]